VAQLDWECPGLSILRLIAVILILATAAGCARWDRRERHRLDGWIGRSERRLVLAAGAPDAVHDLMGGGRILTWRRSYSEQQGGEITTVTETRIVDGQTIIVPVTRQEPTFEFHYECTASFEINAVGIVRGHKLSGNDCDRFLK
jgi:hypothetical protein